MRGNVYVKLYAFLLRTELNEVITYPTAEQEIVIRMTEIQASCRKSLRAADRLAWEVAPSYRVYVMEDCARPFCTRSSVEVQNEKTMLGWC